MIAISGYALQEKMRHNHNIDTYYALRRKDKCKVLLKMPNNHHASSENLAILQHEFHLLKKIKAPSIIKAYDFIQNAAAPVLILEGVEGQLLNSYLNIHQLEISDFFNLALQLVDIIEELHQLNITHKEIRPSNIVINPKKLNLKLIDLSASTKLSEEIFDFTNLSGFEESLAYISPEQTGRINRLVDYRTDFYSLGITLYEMLTNRLPFQSNDPLELVHCHIAKKPPSVLDAQPNTPRMLAAIIDKLLKKMPEERYSSVIGLKSDLQECQKQWQSKGNISKFPLGLNDTKDHLNISRNLYGRKQQVNQLIEAFDRVGQGTKEIIFIAGYSGIGKTSLVKEVHKPIMQHRGYYIQGKFDQLQQSIPYSAIVTAFQNLVKQVLSESESRLQELKEHLIHSLGNVGQVVIDVIPEVELIIGEQPPVPELNPTDAQIRFNLVFQNFVRVFAQANHPLVLFLDDLQWSDNSSLNFIENLSQDRETNYLLIIGAYRDNEIDNYHPLQFTINNLRKLNIAFNILTLQPLQLTDLKQLLADTLSGPPEKIHNLAQCIFDKTHGNPFFINEFIKIIHQEKILTFSYEYDAWEWDLTKIQQQSATDNVIDLLTTKIHILPSRTQEILKLASCIGHQFDFKTLLIVNGQTISKTAEQLCEAIKANLIYSLEKPYKTVGLIGLEEIITDLNISTLHYRFAHDRIQQASYELIAEKDRSPIHLKIGRLLLKEKPLEEQDERLFDVMKHFNQSISLIDDSDERLLLAKYNLWGGQRAKLASAYYTANEYLTAGVELLEPDVWEKNYELAFQLYKELAVCKYFTGDFKAADKYFCELLNHVNNVLDNLEIYRLKIEMLSTLGKHTEALQIGLAALRNFGIKIPKNPNMIHILLAIYRIKFQIKNTKIENIYLPPMVDAKQRAIADLITQLLNSAFITNQQLFIILICKNVSLSLKHGYTESTSMSMPVYAFVIMHSLNLYDEAISFVKLYNRLKQTYGTSNFEGKNQFVLGAFIEPYQSSINASNDTIAKAFRLCCEVGDLVYSNYSNLLLVWHTLSAGKTINDAKKNIQSTLSFMSRVNISDFITVAKFWEYFTQCLENPELVKVGQSASFEKTIIKGKNTTELSFFYGSLTRLHVLLGNFEEAVKAGKNYEIYSDYDKGLLTHLDSKFFFALALFFHFPQASRTERKLYLKKLKHLSHFIEKYATWCPNNFKSYSLLIAGEFAHLRHQYDLALTLYEQAIETALSSGLVLVAAIASECAGRHCLAAKVDRIARLYIQNAHQYFKDWGAITKLKLLERAYPTLNITNNNVTLPKTGPYQTSTQNLDMLAILKFTQLISSEIRLDKLLQKFMVIVLENAGAQRSIILTKVNDRWVIEAEGNLEQQVVYLNNIIPQETDPKYPTSILHYVQRTQKPIILNDATQSELDFHDTYIQQEHPRSLLMMPLFYQGQLCRILYLENKSSSYTFTPSHLSSLQLLSSQAMTSLENAKLYYQATHDPLTGLANRNMLYEIFQQTTKQVIRSQGKIALLFLDLDYFKVINDTLGHDNGDKLLIHIANTLTSTLREGDIAARIGGDEFAVMLANVTSHDQVTIIVERLFHELSKPFHIDDHLMQITSSMGISLFPQDGNDIQTLLKLADTALYQAKEMGRNQFHYYSTELYEEYQRVHGLDKNLQRAYDNQEFFLMYQPFYDINTKQIIGLETLLRWNHPKKGILEAGDFIHTLEKSPLIVPVSEWIIKTACKQAKIWRDKKILSGSIAINVSAIQFIRHSLSDVLSAILSETQLNSSAIELEITETIFIDYNENLHNEIDALQKMGIHLVMDDFGTGYSGLSYLKHLPVNKIKIDKTFIKNCETDYLDQTIISAITTMAHKLNIKVIAEGVENETQLKILQEQGIDGVQGYYYSRPLTAEGCETYLKKNIVQIS
ncbi:regulatory protein (GGDEF domain) [Legionella lansingensis]|uniref:Regulatory protein (GGDEF domain) n=1 Tax=Legionella lansingensis TaxID=45067 RepID=A0A0W0VL16_9GAMM|nr:EAL domain-containing protein [Legionella lansingensis]KTD20796.1 regulatory protein (GGDEF domain) [Legionella lansingensis]SNV49882.1 regulatory protein (GGDEF domain) [Legionella lansingensis]